MLNSEENCVNGLILAAGLSSRMGDFKPLLPFGNKTVIESSIAVSYTHLDVYKRQSLHFKQQEAGSACL